MPLAFYQSVNLFNAILSLIIGVFVLVTKKHTKQIIQFSMFAFFVALWALFYFLAFQSKDYSLSAFLFRTCMIAGALILPTFTEFVYSFVGKGVRLVYRWLNWGVTALIILSVYTRLYAYDGGPFLVFYYWPIINIMSFVQIMHYGFNVYLSHRELFKVSITGEHYQKQQARIMIIGTSIGYFGAATNFLLWFRIPFPPVFNILIPIYVFSIAYAITKHRLMDINVVISRVMAELLTVTFLGSIYISLALFYRNYVSAVIDLPFISWTVLYGVLVGQVHDRIRLFIQTTSDKVFLRGKYDYYKELSGISSQITRSISVENILQTLHKAFYEVLEVSNPRIYLQEDLADPELKEYLNMEEPTLIGNELMLPCLIEGRPIALIKLGKKLSEDPYTEEDVRLLKALANQTAVALDHHRIYEEMLKAQKQILITEKLVSLGNIAAKFAVEAKKPLEELNRLTKDVSLNKEAIKVNKEAIVNEIDRINLLMEDLLGPVRNG